jgi:hypothetical protein
MLRRGFEYLIPAFEQAKVLYTLDRTAITISLIYTCTATLKNTKKNSTPWPESASELYQPSYRRLSAKLVATFVDRRCNVVSVADPYCRILFFIDRSRYFLFQAAPQLYSRGWMDPVRDPLLLRKSASAGNRTRTSGSVGRNQRNQRRSNLFRNRKWSCRIFDYESHGCEEYCLMGLDTM